MCVPFRYPDVQLSFELSSGPEVMAGEQVRVQRLGSVYVVCHVHSCHGAR